MTSWRRWLPGADVDGRRAGPRRAAARLGGGARVDRCGATGSATRRTGTRTLRAAGRVGDGGRLRARRRRRREPRPVRRGAAAGCPSRQLGRPSRRSAVVDGAAAGLELAAALLGVDPAPLRALGRPGGATGRRVGAAASRSMRTRRWRATTRFWRWERCSEATTISRPPTSRGASRSQQPLAGGLGQGRDRTRGAGVEVELDPAVRRVDALAAGSRRAGEPLDQLTGVDDQAVAQPGAGGHAQGRPRRGSGARGPTARGGLTAGGAARCRRGRPGSCRHPRGRRCPSRRPAWPRGSRRATSASWSSDGASRRR